MRQVTDNRCQTMLFVEETLATGKQIIFAYRHDGGPVYCWNIDCLPNSWLAHTAWHPSRVAIGTWNVNTPDSLPHLQPSSETTLSNWLSKTYEYLSPLIGFRSAVFSSSKLFAWQIREQLSFIGKNANVLEVGGSDHVKAVCEAKCCRGWAIDPVFSDLVTMHGETEQVLSQKGSVESLPFQESSFDAVICMFVLEHTINPQAALLEIARVTRYDGVLLLGIPVAQTFIGRPPLFHRWCFTTDCVDKNDKERNRALSLSGLATGKPELFASSSSAWTLVAQDGDACLFKIQKMPNV